MTSRKNWWILVFVVLFTLQAKGDQKVLIGYRNQTAQISVTEQILANNDQISYVYQTIPVIAATIGEGNNLINNPDISYIEPDGTVEICEEAQWGVKKLNAPRNQSLGYKGNGIKLCIMDTGVDYKHQDIKGYVGGSDFVNHDEDPMDDNNHGTHCAGIATAAGNGIGVLGMAPGASLYAVKVLSSDGSGQLSNVIAGVEWCIVHKINIISMSFGGSGGSIALEAVMQKAYESGILLIAAAGNNGGAPVYPAAYDSVVAVSATDVNNKIAYFSSRGPQIEMASPGVEIYSTARNNKYEYKSGTSMACPHVAGAAALLWSAMPGYTNQQIRSELHFAPQDLGSPGRDTLYGYGLPVGNEFPDLNKIAAIKIEPAYTILPKNVWRRVRLTAVKQDGSEEVVSTSPSRVWWETNNATVAFVDETRPYPYIRTTNVPGTAVITATYLGLTVSIQIKNQ